MSFTAAIELMRTPAERNGQALSWARPDRAFFAAGACHILAFRFRDQRRDGAWELVYIRPHDGFVGSHVYVSDGEWAFDFNGWARERLLLEETVRRCRARWPGWDFDRVPLRGTLEQFCIDYRHRLPSQFSAVPLPRADAYIDQSRAIRHHQPPSIECVNMAVVEAWTVLDTNVGSAGYLPLEHRRYALPDGTEAVWDIFGAPASVAILAVTSDDEVVLARQFRPGPGRVLDELPGGGVDPGEDVLAAAERELLEETGYAGNLELAGWSWLASAARTRRHVAVALNARKVAEPSPDPGEFVEVVLMGISRFRSHLRGGELTDVDLGYLALDHLGRLT